MNGSRSRNRERLKDYYISQARENAELVRNPEINLDSSQFAKDVYITRILRDLPLAALLEKEKDVGREIGTLDQSMQSLVYDNYNKFIKATDTIKQMRSDFNEIERSMNQLVSEMDQISTISTKLTNVMKPQREEIAELVQQHETLTKIQFLFELPGELKKKIEENDLVAAVADYQKANRVLENYKNHPSFQSIQDECNQGFQRLVEQVVSHPLEKIMKRTF